MDRLNRMIRFNRYIKSDSPFTSFIITIRIQTIQDTIIDCCLSDRHICQMGIIANSLFNRFNIVIIERNCHGDNRSLIRIETCYFLRLRKGKSLCYLF